MRQEKQDRRSQRTRRLVSAAMMELLIEKRYSAITVQDLLDRAGIGRSTFYAHYYDKNDVLESVVEQMLTSFRQRLSQREPGQGIVPSLEVFRHAWERRATFQAIASGQAIERLLETAQALLSRNIEQALARAYPVVAADATPLPVVAQYLSGAFLNLFRWWMEAEMPYTPEQMDSMFQRLAMPGVWSSIGEASREAREGRAN